MLPTNRPPTHPGIVFFHEFVEPLGLTSTDVARRLKLDLEEVLAFVRGELMVDPDLAARLERSFGVSSGFWLELQENYHVWHARRKH